MKRTMLIVKGACTQRQLDALRQIWDNTQDAQGVVAKLPMLQLSGDKSDIGFISIDETGNIETGSVFGGEFSYEGLISALKEESVKSKVKEIVIG